jgi:oxygen-dependent protoporphyrinogen oxidase
VVYAGRGRSHLTQTVTVLGGGLSGLAAAHFLRARSEARVVLLEAGPRLGGKILTQRVAGMPLEAGPDGFLAEPALLDLCADLGLQPELVEATTTEASFWDGQAMRPLGTGDMRHAGVSGRVPARFLNLREGLASLVARLAERNADVEVRLGTPVAGIEPVAGGLLLHGPGIAADAVVVALPAPAAARLLRHLRPQAADALAGYAYLDLGVVALLYAGRPWELTGSGFLAAARPGQVISGCTYLSAKWPHVARAGWTVLRATVGGSGDRAWAALDDDALVAQVHAELTRILGPAPAPEIARVTRWPEGISDHRARDPRHLQDARAALADLPVVLAAGGYTGGGMAACVAEAARAADAAIAKLAAAR